MEQQFLNELMTQDTSYEARGPHYDDEHAVETASAGPVVPNSIEMWLAPALAMIRAIVSG